MGNVANVIWDPIVGALIDKSNPSLGKYRSYLIYVGLPLSGFAILCFYDGFAPSLLYAYITYIAMTLLYTFINVPYGALNSSLTRDTHEITVLTSVRMFMANIGGLAVNSGLPLVISWFAVSQSDGLPKEPKAWFTTMCIYAIVGMCLLFFCFSQCKEKVVMDASESENVKFYICRHCGNLVGMIHDAGVPMMCCGQKMTALLPNTVEASGEKHLPAVTVEDGAMISVPPVLPLCRKTMASDKPVNRQPMMSASRSAASTEAALSSHCGMTAS